MAGESNVEQRLKQILGEQAFRIVILISELEQAQEKIKQLTNGAEQTPEAKP